MTVESLSWSYHELVDTYRESSQKLLDMGTGGGEFLFTLGHPCENTAVTEAYPPNAALCRERLRPLGIDVRQIESDSDLPFDAHSFNIILNRHEAFDTGEVARILRPGGHFVTQQVGGRNNCSLSERLLLRQINIRKP